MGRFASVGLNRLQPTDDCPGTPRAAGASFLIRDLDQPTNASHLRRVGGAQLRYVKYKVAKADQFSKIATRLFLCPSTGLWVQAWFVGNGSVNGDETRHLLSL